MGQSSFKLLAPDKSASDANIVTCFSWNIEGLKRNIHSLKYFIDLHKPELIFLSEPQVFQCDVNAILETVHGQFSYHLNSEDFHQPDLALDHPKAKVEHMPYGQ